MAALSALEDVLDKNFVHRFLIVRKSNYEELDTEIKTRYPNLKGCLVCKALRGFAITKVPGKKMPVSDRVLDSRHISGDDVFRI